jgi:hypothetical protein
LVSVPAKEGIKQKAREDGNIMKYLIIYQKKMMNTIVQSFPVGVISASSLEVAGDLVFRTVRNKMILNKDDALLILPKNEVKKYSKYQDRPPNGMLFYLVHKNQLSG